MLRRAAGRPGRSPAESPVSRSVRTAEITSASAIPPAVRRAPPAPPRSSGRPAIAPDRRRRRRWRRTARRAGSYHPCSTAKEIRCGEPRKSGCVGEVRRHLADHPGPADPDAVRPHPLGHPQPLAACELDHHPALAGVGDQVRVAAVGGLAVALDQLADQLDSLACRARPLQHDARQVAVVQPALVGRRHRPQPLGAGRPDVAHGDAVLVEAAVGQRRGDAAVIRVVDAQVAGGDRAPAGSRCARRASATPR